jgi:hypothetical protein
MVAIPRSVRSRSTSEKSARSPLVRGTGAFARALSHSSLRLSDLSRACTSHLAIWGATGTDL